MRTPRPTSRPSVSTLIGNGFLPDPPPRESWPREWDVRGKKLLRKCMFLPYPPHLQAMVNALPESVRQPSRLPPPEPLPAVPLPEPRRAPDRFARIFPAVADPTALADTGARARAALLAREKAKLLDRPAPPARQPAAGTARWFEDPVVIGTLLLLTPPIGLAALWSSRRYASDARWALTMMTGLTMCIGAAVVITMMIVRG